MEEFLDADLLGVLIPLESRHHQPDRPIEVHIHPDAFTVQICHPSSKVQLSVDVK
jgi:hypothetical protein